MVQNLPSVQVAVQSAKRPSDSILWQMHAGPVSVRHYHSLFDCAQFAGFVNVLTDDGCVCVGSPDFDPVSGHLRFGSGLAGARVIFSHPSGM